jgi:predicted DNA-binding transcriptional regulator AlpA
MESIKIDRTKLLTVQNYAKRFGISRPTVYTKLKDKALEKVEIDGVTFIKLD